MRRGELLGLRWQDIQENVVTVKQNVVDIKGTPTIQTPKTQKGRRRIAIARDVAEVLETHKKRQATELDFLGAVSVPHDLVFTSEVGMVIHPRNLSRTWEMLENRTREAWQEQLEAVASDEQRSQDEREQAAKDIEALAKGVLFPHMRLHDLRHLHASIAIREGMDLMTGQKSV